MDKYGSGIHADDIAKSILRYREMNRKGKMSDKVAKEEEDMAWEAAEEEGLTKAVQRALQRMTEAIPASSIIGALYEEAEASGIEVGHIFVSSWGYDQTNIDFYEVVKVSGAMATIRKIEKRLVSGRGDATEYVEPIRGRFVGEPMRRRVKEMTMGGKKRYYVSINTYAGAFSWGGKPEGQTGAAYGR